MSPSPHTFHLRDYPGIREYGFAVEHFPRYVSIEEEPHRLDVVLLTYLARGRASHVMDGATFEDGPGSLGITHYGQSHVLRTDTEGVEVYNLYLDLEKHPLPPMPPTLQRVLPQVIPLDPRFGHEANRHLRLRFEDPDELGDILRIVHREQARGRGPGATDAAQAALRLILIACCRQALREGLARPDDGAGSQSPVETVRLHLDACYDQPHTLEDLARRAGSSRSHLCRTFRQRTGRTPFEYLIERRIQAAMVALRTTDHKVLAIALESGFHDLAHFNRCFRRLVGCPPSVYRKGLADS